MVIVRAEAEDIERILAVQRLAYQSQAALVNDFSIPPLTETPEDVLREYQSVVILKAVRDSAIIGSIRGRVAGDTCYIGRLFVHPNYQGHGYGTRLLAEIETVCPAPRCELFTSNKSIDNIRLYEKAGYVFFKEATMLADYTLVYMEKLLPTNGIING